jgi:hypothetical protein
MRRSRQEVTSTAASSRPRRDTKSTSGSNSGSTIGGDTGIPQRRPSKIKTDSISPNVKQEQHRSKRKRATTKGSDAEINPRPTSITKKRHRPALVVALKLEHHRSTSVVSDLSANASGATEEKSPLLALPAEIRNEIWKWSMRMDHPLSIVGDTPKQPPLTKTCRQIRAESIRFFYKENSFSCTIFDYDPADFKRYRQVADKYGLSTVLLTHQHRAGAPRAQLRTNMMKWLEGTFRGETAPLGYSAGHSEDTFVWDKLSHRIVKIFAIAKSLKQQQVSWSAAQDIMSNALDAAGVCGEKRR